MKPSKITKTYLSISPQVLTANKFFNPSLNNIPSFFTILLLLSHLASIIGNLISYTWRRIALIMTTKTTSPQPHPPHQCNNSSEALHIASHLRTDPEEVGPASVDFGKAVTRPPAAVFYPSSVNDVISLVKHSNIDASGPFTIAARGRGHSLRGQAMAEEGVVIEMTSLNTKKRGERIRVIKNSASNPNVIPNVMDDEDLRSGFCGYVDAGGEQLWIDVLEACLEEGLAPVSWTDYLYLTVGGTLSNGGISGQTFRHGPQICNIRELDVVTGA